MRGLQLSGSGSGLRLGYLYTCIPHWWLVGVVLYGWAYEVALRERRTGPGRPCRCTRPAGHVRQLTAEEIWRRQGGAESREEWQERIARGGMQGSRSDDRDYTGYLGCHLGE